MRKKPSYTAFLRPTRLLISEKSATYTIKWSYTIIWQVRVVINLSSLDFSKIPVWNIKFDELDFWSISN